MSDLFLRDKFSPRAPAAFVAAFNKGVATDNDRTPAVANAIPSHDAAGSGDNMIGLRCNDQSPKTSVGEVFFRAHTQDDTFSVSSDQHMMCVASPRDALGIGYEYRLW